LRTKRIDVGLIRREQIVTAAVEIIARHGLPELSLSRIEQQAGMSRGQLTYYFPTKEDILLAVFDRLLQLMYERARERLDTANGECGSGLWEFLERLLGHVLGSPWSNPEFHALQYTFLSQMGHRKDFRRRLARLYEEWRSHMAGMLAEHLAGRPELGHVGARELASLIQAILHGLGMQLVADAKAFDPEQMKSLCLEVLRAFLERKPTRNGSKSAATGNGMNGSKTPKTLKNGDRTSKFKGPVPVFLGHNRSSRE
jgi:AcrR family transcriptional regulator